MLLLRLALALGLAVCLAGECAAQARTDRPPHNVLLIVADDLGVDVLERYGLRAGGPYPATPNLDRIADAGLLFRRAWSAPECSPTRATIQTGKFGCRTGIGTSVSRSGSVALAESPLNLGRAVADLGYDTAAFGKWHLSPARAVCSPVGAGGYSWFVGTIDTVTSSGYCSWPRLTVRAGCASQLITSQVYYTTDVCSAARVWIDREARPQQQRWLCYLAPQAPFEILHVPPPGLHAQHLAAPPCSKVTMEPVAAYFAALEALDFEIGRILDQLDLRGIPWYLDTTVIFVGDNGTPNNINNLLGYWPPWSAKGSLFRGGVHVPLIIAGSAVSRDLWGQETDQMVQTVDLYATAIELCGGRAPAGIDGISLLPVLRGSTQRLRTWLYAERFSNRVPPIPCEDYRWTMRDDRYKLIEHVEWRAFYDLQNDPFELNSIPIPKQPGDPGWSSYQTFLANLPHTCQ